MNKDGSNQTQLTKSSGLVGFVEWSPDGSKISYVAKSGGQWEIFIMNNDGTGQHKLFDNSGINGPHSWTSDSNHILYESNRDVNFDIYKVNIKNLKLTRLTINSGSNSDPAMQPAKKELTKIKYDISKILSAKIKGL